MTERDDVERAFPVETYTMSYIRECVAHGWTGWGLFDCHGSLIHCERERSAAFFCAADLELQIVMLH